MQFFSKEVESEPLSWDVHSQTSHSVSNITYLGQNNDGWIILQLWPRFPNEDGTMARALQSACVDMANPDEDGDTQPKSSKLIKKDDNSSTIVEIEDVMAFLNHLSYCQCITAMDAKLISNAISKHQRQPEHSSSLSSSTTTTHNQDTSAQSQLDKLRFDTSTENTPIKY